ncbi:Alpha/Beta hydrolase protein [Amylocarpus encephaloides]|uniref:Alpha/Beta hydrolase protein n=1 Tax=Amylocarpus encephaloides TaxID=45428 RepID=A0A9P8C3C7_9HELO|nr:Alpha/Beta hydrolase protein [Amylocarpus encephaloides]
MLALLNRAALCRRHRSSILFRDQTPRVRSREPTFQPLIRHGQSRDFVNIPTILVPPLVFGGLVIALWTWKCFMMVVFQNKIIYMPGLPPNARRETIADYKNQCGGIQWREERIRSLDGTRISLCVATVETSSLPAKTVYILYFQGNASSLPPRLPFLSPVLRLLKQRASHSEDNVKYTMICCSYRGYWTSSGRATERGIAMDAGAALQWILQDRNLPGEQDVPVVIWGQSIGAGVATTLASEREFFKHGLSPKALILETPFLSIRAMLETLYPQKWLPYRHLWPFLRNQLNSEKALGLMHERFGAKAPRVVILAAGKDELVPAFHGQMLENTGSKLGLDVKMKTIDSALHTEVMGRQEGILSVVDTIEEVAQTREEHPRQQPNPIDYPPRRTISNGRSTPSM